MGIEGAFGHREGWRAAAGRLGTSLVGLFFPTTCLACAVMVQREGALCVECWKGLQFIEEPVCPVLGVPFSYQVDEGTVSPAAMANPPAFDAARSAVLYDDIARLLVHRLKYKDRAELALPMARWMLRAGAGIIESSDIVLPVPLHRARLLLRRYNQAAELGRTLSGLAGKPFGADVLIRRRATRQQVGLGQKAREANVRGAFKVKRPEDVMGRNVLLIDDVFTTGATVNAAARALRRAGAAKICILTFARVGEPDHPA
ncbi:ComF family protein [Pararhizobium haloflavum]|uniref:ComF family protein n=1 Tax=Pararhizobium haloflavum TaxID=2037914 RepID=UPI000C180636|nr:ComF family protein [Pararhizobium haloflavum]